MSQSGVFCRLNHLPKVAGERFRQYVPRLLCLGILIAFVFATGVSFAQSIISGDISGVVTDPSGAAIPNVSVTLNSKSTGETRTATTSATGSYRFALLRPGEYEVSVRQSGFAPATQHVVVAVGQVTSSTIQLKIGSESQTVEVTTSAPLLQTENANITTSYTPTEIELTPNPGGDLTNYALTAPGVVLSTGAGYGNFSTNGLGGTSNLYTINGNDTNDPYNNLNNSGSSNNMLGQNEIQELAIVDNGYTGQYGRAAGANMNFTTKSGTNSFHGNAKWDWNGRYLNANDWFNNDSATPRPFANSNQWAGSIGGPIIKNRLFFFYDNEGLRYVLPAGGVPVFIPTTAFANAVQANINATQPAEAALYAKMFSVYAGAPGASRATPVPVGDATTQQGGCGLFAGSTLGGTLFGTAGGAPCTQTFRSLTNNLNTERLMSIRIDLEAGSRDRMNFRYWQDRGSQPTFTDPINAAFNALSVQPQDNGQFTETHTFGTHVVNQFIASGSYYSAVFGPASVAATVAVFPTNIGGSVNGGNSCTAFDGDLTCIQGEVGARPYPAGRNVTQYQFVDDLTWTKGRHGLKFGLNLRRIDFADYTPAGNQTGLVNLNSITDLVNGTLSSSGGSTFQQNFSSAPDFQIASYSLGVYAQDEWTATKNLKLTLSLRVDRNSNETCRENCFARLVNNFSDINHNAAIPYNQAILFDQSQLFANLQRVVWQPRFGFAYSPWDQKTVFRGGVGFFSDLYPAQVDSFTGILNPPTTGTFIVAPNAAAPAPIAFLPGAPAGAYTQASNNHAAFTSQLTAGGTLATATAAVPGFQPPAFYTLPQTFKNPTYEEWNFAIQQEIDRKSSLTLNYVGNHGYHEIVRNNGANAYSATGFGGLPTVAPDLRFGRVRDLTNAAVSNYNGLTATVVRKFSRGFQGSFNYTWSHALDEMSNGGIEPYSTNTSGDSLRYQIDPLNLRRFNYGNADYDFRRVMSVSYIWELPFKAHGVVNHVVGGWSVSGVLYKRSSAPYSVVNTSLTSVVSNDTSGSFLAGFLGGPTPNCSVGLSLSVGCLQKSEFQSTATQTDFGTVGRNAFRGPAYFNTDVSVKKNFRITDSGLTFELGANGYNILNHPNFANPNDSLSSGSFGQIQSTVTPASSPYGNFQGSAVSGRVLQLELQVKF
jgi:hypothetical protein